MGIMMIGQTNRKSFILIVEKENVLASILLTAFTIIFSFGVKVPGFKYLPLASNLVPGRILTYTTVTGAIVGAYGVYTIWNSKKLIMFCKILTLSLVIGIVIGMNPYQKKYALQPSKEFESMLGALDTQNSAFDKGRYEWFGGIDSSETFFPILYDYNTSDGWNIEGTVHNFAIWNNTMSFSTENYDYIAKNIEFWNVRAVYLKDMHQGFEDTLVGTLGYKPQKVDRPGYSLYTSDKPSSYYLMDNRNAIILSKGTEAFVTLFPNIVQGRSNNILDYTVEELKKYNVIYVYEPEIKTLSHKNSVESMITELISYGCQIIIEPGIPGKYDIFDVYVNEERVESETSFHITKEDIYSIEKDVKLNIKSGTIRSLYGLDKVYANLVQNNGNLKNAIVGLKQVGDGEVLFLGAHLSQYLLPTYTRNNGLNQVNEQVIQNSEAVESIFSSIFSYYRVNEEFLPDTFESILDHSWEYNGGEFHYLSDKDSEVVVSITYSPRWKAYLDGEQIEIGQSENLIVLNLPAGDHRVELQYGVTIYGKIGYIISIVGLLMFILAIFCWNPLMRFIDKKNRTIRGYLQLEEENEPLQEENKEALAHVTDKMFEEPAANTEQEDKSMVIDIKETNNKVRVEIIDLYSKESDTSNLE